ncbi:MAG: hypothetical protein OXH47_04905 [Paracoccaceae bacterium]|nr:hypothetical protein [Paracoccaceae bacterium]
MKLKDRNKTTSKAKSDFEAIYKRFDYLEKNRDDDYKPTNLKSEEALLKFAKIEAIKPGNIGLAITGNYSLFHRGNFLRFHDIQNIYFKGKMVSLKDFQSR